MAIGIMVSTFGYPTATCRRARLRAMARDRLFFRSAGELNAAKVPAWALVLQGLWAIFRAAADLRSGHQAREPLTTCST
jgi:APA family basic amino acid/polyamine antiporter